MVCECRPPGSFGGAATGAGNDKTSKCVEKVQLAISVKRSMGAAPVQVDFDCHNASNSPTSNEELAMMQSARTESSELGAVSTSERLEEAGTSAARQGLHTAPSLMKCTLHVIIKAIPTAAASTSPFLARINACPGDWMLEALVQHLWEQGLQRQIDGRGCGVTRRALRKLQEECGTVRVVQALRAAGVRGCEAVGSLLQMMHQHEYKRRPTSRDRLTWEVLPALMAPDATVEELAEVLACARTLGMGAIFHMGIAWDLESVADFIAVLFSDIEEAYGLLDVEMAFDYKRISSYLCSLMRAAGVQPTARGILQMTRLCKEALPVHLCGRPMTEDMAGFLYSALVMLLPEDHWAGLGAVLGAMEECFEEAFDMREVHRYYAGCSWPQYILQRFTGREMFHVAAVDIVIGYGSVLQLRGKGPQQMCSQIAAAVRAISLDCANISKTPVASQESPNQMPSAGKDTNIYELASIHDPEPIVALAYQLHQRGMLGGYILGLFLCELMPQARWLPTEAAELIVQIRSWPTNHTLTQQGVTQSRKRIRLEYGLSCIDVAQEEQGDSQGRSACRKSKNCRFRLPQTTGCGIPSQDPIPIVGHRGNNLSQVLIGLCGPATSWDSRWLHAVMQVLQEQNWTWGEIGEFMYESMEGTVEYKPQYKPSISIGNAKTATSLRLAQYCSCEACLRIKQQHVLSQQPPELFRCLNSATNVSI